MQAVIPLRIDSLQNAREWYLFNDRELQAAMRLVARQIAQEGVGSVTRAWFLNAVAHGLPLHHGTATLASDTAPVINMLTNVVVTLYSTELEESADVGYIRSLPARTHLHVLRCAAGQLGLQPDFPRSKLQRHFRRVYNARLCSMCSVDETTGAVSSATPRHLHNGQCRQRAGRQTHWQKLFNTSATPVRERTPDVLFSSDDENDKDTDAVCTREACNRQEDVLDAEALEDEAQDEGIYDVLHVQLPGSARAAALRQALHTQHPKHGAVFGENVPVTTRDLNALHLLYYHGAMIDYLDADEVVAATRLLGPRTLTYLFVTELGKFDNMFLWSLMPDSVRARAVAAVSESDMSPNRQTRWLIEVLLRGAPVSYNFKEGCDSAPVSETVRLVVSVYYNLLVFAPVIYARMEARVAQHVFGTLAQLSTSYIAYLAANLQLVKGFGVHVWQREFVRLANRRHCAGCLTEDAGDGARVSHVGGCRSDGAFASFWRRNVNPGTYRAMENMGCVMSLDNLVTIPSHLLESSSSSVSFGESSACDR